LIVQINLISEELYVYLYIENSFIINNQNTIVSFFHLYAVDRVNIFLYEIYNS